MITTPSSLTITHLRSRKKLQDAYESGTLAQLVTSDKKLKKDTVFLPTELTYIPGTDKLHVTMADQSQRRFVSQVFNKSGFGVAEFISSEMMNSRPPREVALADVPKLRKPWVLFPLGMAALMAGMFAGLWIVAGLFESDGSTPLLAEVVRRIPLWGTAALCLAVLVLGATQSFKRSKTDMKIYQYV